MTDYPDINDTRTAGELRRRLAALGNPWTVDPRLADTDPLPSQPRGGQTPEEVPEELRVPLRDIDELRAELYKYIPSNPHLRDLWQSEGLMPEEQVAESRDRYDRPEPHNDGG
jgi:hypothetical protein